MPRPQQVEAESEGGAEREACLNSLSVAVLYNSAVAQIDMERPDRGMNLLKMALDLVPSEIEDKPLVAKVFVSLCHHMAIIYYNNNKAQEAMLLLNAAIREGERTLGMHEVVRSLYDAAAKMFMEWGMIAEGLEARNNALRISDQCMIAREVSTKAQLAMNSCAPGA